MYLKERIGGGKLSFRTTYITEVVCYAGANFRRGWMEVGCEVFIEGYSINHCFVSGDKRYGYSGVPELTSQLTLIQ
jgi:hypothetical protein